MLGSKLDILKQEWIDVVFSSRNKAYGAYELRRQNSKNTTKALIISVLLFAFFVSLPTVINMIQGFIPKADVKVKMTEVVLTNPPPVNPNTPKPPPPVHQEPTKARQSTVKFPPMVVKPDVEVKEEDPPTVKELATADPGQKDIKGDPNAEIHIDAPIGNADAHAVVDDPNKIYQTVEQLPQYPGGDDAFIAFLRKTINYPGVAIENGVQGVVILTFVCERDGSLTDIKVTRPLGSGCDEEAIRALKKSPKWRPGIQNGQPVRVQYSVPVQFSLGGG